MGDRELASGLIVGETIEGGKVGKMRRVLLGGIAGAVPGLLIASVPLVLNSLDVITSDESQIGFIGVPLIFIGVFVGTGIGARSSEHPGRVILGVGIGFLVGVVGGIVIGGVASTGPLWLVVVPAAMVLGGALAARGDQDDDSRQLPAAQQ
jgi:hypothetical protein